ncbi:hypothetical protein PPERSA_11754 [Pseudocohnilembus persalinus]|uniref:Uncharacterized protein n=1 Tax=Pseudocohnilembus persalinus TaxID=266149 RepID=A0A0V0QGI3_PSEPJ|nr:hypothetical protein PPERSA_11754 [Pseudocohnilembus persalinus]|eukprot:KRX01307.1 hypothetical protein PPERSA_11754 [Pseudocohnilembus persalinus]
MCQEYEQFFTVLILNLMKDQKIQSILNGSILFFNYFGQEVKCTVQEVESHVKMYEKKLQQEVIIQLRQRALDNLKSRENINNLLEKIQRQNQTQKEQQLQMKSHDNKLNTLFKCYI